jgi:hypothetical protein
MSQFGRDWECISVAKGNVAGKTKFDHETVSSHAAFPLHVGEPLIFDQSGISPTRFQIPSENPENP